MRGCLVKHDVMSPTNALLYTWNTDLNYQNQVFNVLSQDNLVSTTNLSLKSCISMVNLNENYLLIIANTILVIDIK